MGRPVAEEGMAEAADILEHLKGDRASLVVHRVGFPFPFFPFSQGKNKSSQIFGTMSWATRFNSGKDIPIDRMRLVRRKC